MHILITGGTGLIGLALSKKLSEVDFSVTILTRKKTLPSSTKNISFVESIENPINPYDIIINLAGEPLNHRRWTPLTKKRIYSSRIDMTRKIINYIKNAPRKPHTLLSGSAIGFYGQSLTQIFDEFSTPTDDSFTSTLCQDWEAIANEATPYGVRVCNLRTGIVLDKTKGALKEMITPFRYGLGAQLGDGQQAMSWIHLQDVIDAIAFLIQHTDLSGPFNLTAPVSVTNAEFTKELGKTLHRLAFLKMPAFMVKLLFGEMGSTLLLQGQKVIPKRLLSAGYTFKFETLNKALHHIIHS